MKHWRVGSLSMGLSMLLLGGLLLFYQWQGLEVLHWLIAWWPLAFILLGLEILVYLVIQRQGKNFISYDLLSILFVGMLGTMCLALTLFSSTGVLAEVQQALRDVEYTQSLPAVRQTVPEEVRRIVVQLADDTRVHVEGTSKKEIHFMGRVQTTQSFASEMGSLAAEGMLDVQIMEDTLYVSLKEEPRKNGLFSGTQSAQFTLFLPNQLPVEILGSHSSLNLNPGRLNSNWVVQDVRHVKLRLLSGSNMRVTAITDQVDPSSNITWDALETWQPASQRLDGQEETESDTTVTELPAQQHWAVYEEGKLKGSLTLGSGEHQLQILNSDLLQIHLLADD